MLKIWLLKPKIVVTSVLLIIFLIAIFDNSRPTVVRFWNTTFELPLSAWLFIAYLLGVLTVLSVVLMGWFSTNYSKIKANKEAKKQQVVIEKEEEKTS